MKSLIQMTLSLAAMTAASPLPAQEGSALKAMAQVAHANRAVQEEVITAAVKPPTPVTEAIAPEPPVAASSPSQRRLYMERIREKGQYTLSQEAPTTDYNIHEVLKRLGVKPTVIPPSSPEKATPQTQAPPSGNRPVSLFSEEEKDKLNQLPGQGAH